jgi:hypothetical protein
VLAALAALAAGCGGGGGGSRGGGGGAGDGGPAAFAWGVSQGLWGEERLTISEDGEAHYHFVSARGQPGVDRTVTLSAAELAPLRAATLRPEFCELRSQRDGIPDEGMPTLEVQSAERTCKVTLWDGEWEDMAAARPARDAIDQIIRRIKAG